MSEHRTSNPMSHIKRFAFKPEYGKREGNLVMLEDQLGHWVRASDFNYEIERLTAELADARAQIYDQRESLSIVLDKERERLRALLTSIAADMNVGAKSIVLTVDDYKSSCRHTAATIREALAGVADETSEGQK